MCVRGCLFRLEKLLALERTLDTVVWQLLASVICPGYTIHTVVALAHAALLPLEVHFLRRKRSFAVFLCASSHAGAPCWAGCACDLALLKDNGAHLPA